MEYSKESTRNGVITIKPEAVFNKKGWGYERVIHNDSDYCSKILHFKMGGKSSFHFHVCKKESWYVASGIFILKYIDTRNADIKEVQLCEGDIVSLNIGVVHQLYAVTEGEIFEASQSDMESDSFRIEKGDSQK